MKFTVSKNCVLLQMTMRTDGLLEDCVVALQMHTAR